MCRFLFASMFAAGLVVPALAEDAGAIKIHSGWKLIQERVDKGVAYGTLWGITFNDAGSGPLHRAPASGTYNLVQESGKGEGELTWGAGDDQLKGTFTIVATPDGKATGENIVKGTGKFAGITGGPFECAFVGKPEDQQAWCTEVFNRK
ncbi:hypothetical protein LPJ38_17255 [Bradyrhizobium daqingense]|uniref:Uncharacterized protein n=1 Tax=Bradyrhizobium daqingense TaxID=993502 RepID=A0A562LUS3_9BRAD|nr:hypothetical protein [Bradyrhizobium daqingense]TWI11313.1 hypothetical protein IQ17_00463 [Bradyrhizobium daqingense]UFS92386.1 hypothetical protein LPJ38_17255 [Bradyrhizobium daqingense]